MGREIRLVSEKWEHPKKSGNDNQYIPLLEFDPEYYKKEDYDQYTFMPIWTKKEKTHMMMYENTSEGTPISKKFKIGENERMARSLVKNNASAFGSSTASYEQWLAMIKQGSAPSAVLINGELKSGVEASEKI